MILDLSMSLKVLTKIIMYKSSKFSVIEIDFWH